MPLNLEAGRIFALNACWSLTPQAQLSYTNSSFDKFTDSVNSLVISEQDYKSLEGRLGLAVNYERSYCGSDGFMRRMKVYGLGNLYHEFKGDSTISVSTVRYKSTVNKTWVGVTLGGSYNWKSDRYSVYGELGGKSSTKKFGSEFELTAEVGFRFAF